MASVCKLNSPDGSGNGLRIPIEFTLPGDRMPFHEPSTGLGRASQGRQCSLRRGDLSVDLTDLRTRICQGDLQKITLLRTRLCSKSYEADIDDPVEM